MFVDYYVRNKNESQFCLLPFDKFLKINSKSTNQILQFIILYQFIFLSMAKDKSNSLILVSL